MAEATMSKKQIADALDRLSTQEIQELLENRKQKRVESLLKEREELQNRLGENTRELQALGHSVLTGRTSPRGGRPARSPGAGAGRSRMPSEEYEEHVIACLRKSDGAEASVSDIREYVQEKGGSPNTLQQSILPNLVKEGKIESPRRGNYRLPRE